MGAELPLQLFNRLDRPLQETNTLFNRQLAVPQATLLCSTSNRLFSLRNGRSISAYESLAVSIVNPKANGTEPARDEIKPRATTSMNRCQT